MNIAEYLEVTGSHCRFLQPNTVSMIESVELMTRAIPGLGRTSSVLGPPVGRGLESVRQLLAEFGGNDSWVGELNDRE
jgi:hypothetical protein